MGSSVKRTMGLAMTGVQCHQQTGVHLGPKTVVEATLISPPQPGLTPQLFQTLLNQRCQPNSAHDLPLWLGRELPTR